jgi:ADP-heptose:LPS heptosyltransferase
MADFRDSLKLTLYQLIYHLVRCAPASRGTAHLLLVKTDEIGDYVLMRNLLRLFKHTGPYQHYKITFVGNIVFRQLYESYDSDLADEVIWLDKKKFRSDLRYRFKLLKQIRRVKASDVISLVYSRIWRKDDVIVAVSPAPVKVGMKHNTRLITSYEKRLTPVKIYTQLLDSGDDTLFDACRNARYIESLLQIPPQRVSTAITPKADISGLGLPARYFVVFPGSGIPEKKWPSARFAAVVHHMVQRYGLAPVVCGAPGDRADSDAFLQEYAAPVLDLTGKTSLPGLLAVFRNAACLVSVDTGSVHLAAAVGCPVFALYSGLHYGRFAPYPPELASQFYPVYPDEVDELIRERAAVDFEMIPIDLVKTIPAEKLIARIDEAWATHLISKNT